MVVDAGQGYAKIYKMEEKRKIDEVVYEVVSRFWFMRLIYLVINLFINVPVAKESFYIEL